ETSVQKFVWHSVGEVNLSREVTFECRVISCCCVRVLDNVAHANISKVDDRGEGPVVQVPVHTLLTLDRVDWMRKLIDDFVAAMDACLVQVKLLIDRIEIHRYIGHRLDTLR